jgi:hypothetical protein
VSAFPVSPIRLDRDLNLLVGFVQSIIAEARSVKAEYHNSSAAVQVGDGRRRGGGGLGMVSSMCG